jgi:hypothetical protein
LQDYVRSDAEPGRERENIFELETKRLGEEKNLTISPLKNCPDAMVANKVCDDSKKALFYSKHLSRKYEVFFIIYRLFGTSFPSVSLITLCLISADRFSSIVLRAFARSFASENPRDS